ncbi:hypothetical protein [Cupriavidus lacunae]|uniref:hypothetical protein n=1 Tax=Cupriavidus lacunae TaxID=2666307 RepID=UPI001058B80B|nr:hypothetical protein [Cupriavidus lacunae]
MTIFARIDHAEAASNAVLAMPPTQVTIHGNATRGKAVDARGTQRCAGLASAQHWGAMPARATWVTDAAELGGVHPLPAGSAAAAGGSAAADY